MTDTVAANSEQYRSPIMGKIQGSGRLTLELLRIEVPRFQAGRKAHLLLKDEPDHPDRETLLATEKDGEQAKERLVRAAIPLIKMLAQKEHWRRQNWRSRVTFEDLMQEGVSGYLRGLMAYNPDGGQRSPTNYLGQWILTEMKRNTESIDNDFGVAFDAAERFRRIRALRSRLSGDLGREPTDEEIIAASIDPAYATGHKMGRLNKPVNPSRQLTQAQLDEERLMRTRVGYTSRLVSGGDDDQPGPMLDRARPMDGGLRHDLAESVADRSARAAVSSVLDTTLVRMALPPVQRDIIARRYGLPPHSKEESARDISKALKVHREKVSRVLEAFSIEMSRPGGAFHYVCSQLPTDELIDIGLGWVPDALGSFTDAPTRSNAEETSEILYTALRRQAASEHPVATPGNTSKPGVVHAQFQCGSESTFFVSTYPAPTAVPKARSCPACQQRAHLIQLL